VMLINLLRRSGPCRPGDLSIQEVGCQVVHEPGVVSLGGLSSGRARPAQRDLISASAERLVFGVYASSIPKC
jgi:hypothetical protein